MRNRAKNQTDPTRHAEMLIAVSGPSDRTLLHGGQHFSPGGSSDTLLSSDPREIAAFLKDQCLTMGFTIQFAINPETKEVIKLLKRGKVAQKDVRELAEAGFTEWTFSWTWSPDFFRFPDGSIVKVAGEIDLSPTKTLAEAIRWGKATGRISR